MATNQEFTFIFLTYNEEVHLPRTLAAIQSLGARICILDSGSTDKSRAIAESFHAEWATHAFTNHAKQWEHALTCFQVSTPWMICLDADQVVSKELLERLTTFKSESIPTSINGIYFNRKNKFRGRWIRHGGYFPKYLLKMFRTGKGHSDLNENMDHKFIVTGETTVWKDGYIEEENFKENEIDFWLSKHLRYSTLVAQEEIERMKKLRVQSQERRFFGTPDQRIAWMKAIWWKLPLYWRPVLYFLYRFVFLLGFLDGKQGRLFHFLQGYWFRLIVDVKIEELLKKERESNAGKPE